MPSLTLLRELQATHDYLRTVERDLSAFPPDLAALDTKLKAIAKRRSELEKALTDGRTTQEKLAKELGLTQKMEAQAREALKSTTQRVQYTAAVREVDQRERERAAVAKPLKELETRLDAYAQELARLQEESATLQAQFDELHTVFLSEHENQAIARKDLTSKLTELQGQMPQADLTRFQRLLQQRQGRAVVAVENGICTGCRTKLRVPLMGALREAKETLVCESCSRVLYLA